MDAAFQVGDRVRVPWGRGYVPGLITEDRGPIGVGGRRLYQISAHLDPMETEPTTFELREDEFETLRESDDPGTGLDSAKIINYLKNGGLIFMLQTLGRHGANAWLCLDSLGNLTSTALKQLGRIGGKPAPFGAIRDLRILAPKRDEVSEFLQGFGLDRTQANDVIESVGTVPVREATGASRRA